MLFVSNGRKFSYIYKPETGEFHAQKKNMLISSGGEKVHPKSCTAKEKQYVWKVLCYVGTGALYEGWL